MAEYVHTGVAGLDELFDEGIPEQSVNLVVGNPGSGKSILGLQTLQYAVEDGETVLYLSLEEHREQLEQHLHDFGWAHAVDEDRFHIEHVDAFEVADAVETWFERQREDGENPFETSAMPAILQQVKDIAPDRIVVDSLSAIESGFADRDRYYRMYVNQFFNFFKELGTDAFVIVESQSIPEQITEKGQAEFLADGIILLHRTHHSRGAEIYKMRGSGFKEKIAPMEITEDEGLVVHADESFFPDNDDAMF